MEVHHHPHVEKKNFKEYFLEFLMIFLAVTLGFFAESLRENITSHHREKQYMQSMLEDLKSDTSMLMHGYQAAIFEAKGMDSLKTMLYTDPVRMDVPVLYRLQVEYSIVFGLIFNERTSSQLKAGGMNFIKNRKVANEISNYWLNKDILLNTLDNINSKLDRAYEFRYSIFNFKYADLNMMDPVSKNLESSIDPHSRLLSADPALLVNYANRLSYVIVILKRRYSVGILKQYKSATDLIALIQKVYNLK
jgi:hypothetical protein